MLTTPRTFLALSLAVLTGPACASRTVQSTPLHPPASRAALWAAAFAMRDSSLGPFFPPGYLSEAVQLIRRIGREHPATAEVVMPDTGADDLNTRTAVEFQLSDSLARAVCGIDTVPPLKLVERSLTPPLLGVARFDSITDALGGARVMRLSTSLGRCYVKLFYDRLLNEPGAERAYAALRPHIDLPVSHFLEKGWVVDGIRILTGDSVWRVRISAGWGDCPSGCIYRHVWEFTYHRVSGRIDKVVDSGPPLPPRRERIGL